jgi:molybdopterin molybdotransferase
MLSPAEADSAIREHVPLLAPETRPLDMLVGSVLREPIYASRDQPPFDRVTMDGIAFAYSAYSEGRKSFRIAGTQAAGAPPLGLATTESCLEVMTGAMLPSGCDCVVPIEKLTVRDGIAHVLDEASPALGANVHRRGIDCEAGRLLLTPGTRLGPTEIAIIASTGLSHASVSREPRIVVISTGDELVEPGLPVLDWQIYRSNAYAVVSALQQRGFGKVHQDHLRDDLTTMRTRLRILLDEHDVIVLSGGVSMGRFDHVPEVLQELGIDRVFHKISQRPGKPMWFGIGAGGKAVYALPGNPVSTLVCLARYVYPGLAASQGAASQKVELVALDADFEVKPALSFFLPVSLVHKSGTTAAQPRPTQGSGDFTSLLDTHGFVELPAGPTVVSQHTLVPLYRW